ncbi:hypothetical protein SISNIDRAFT_490784 [Sistotremastrum niveocremeum HHB9708]|uniref:Ubiquitin-like protease family profile domain-containing protein n=1 Tax=Sistotremastrum niveocremeum HHB9708 TaxID=1314777 RepID=A0A164NLF5_9AGAM|nr:hypothetical protein SISNIDRAFT_490784 [Sistotremastrum niveocremeum HHB9708]
MAANPGTPPALPTPATARPRKDFISLDDEPPCGPEELRQIWLGQGKIFADIPEYVKDLYTQDFVIPIQLYNQLLPPPALNVIDALKFDMPKRANAFSLKIDPSLWSTEEPTVTITHPLFLSHIIPSFHGLQSLHEASRQAWLDGTRSIKIPGHAGRYPLFLITLYREASRVLDIISEWQISQRWITAVPDGTEGKEEVMRLLDCTGWANDVETLGRLQTTSSLYQILSQEWFDDIIMTAGLAYIQSHCAKPKNFLSIEFSNGLHILEAETWPPEKYETDKRAPIKYLRDQGQKLKKLAESEVKDDFWFFLHIDNTHWVAASFNPHSCTLSISDSRSRAIPAKIQRGMNKWVSFHFKSKRLRTQSVTAPRQVDHWSCGVVTLHTLASKAGLENEDRPWTDATQSLHSLLWFRRLTTREKCKLADMPAVVRSRHDKPTKEQIAAAAAAESDGDGDSAYEEGSHDGTGDEESDVDTIMNEIVDENGNQNANSKTKGSTQVKRTVNKAKSTSKTPLKRPLEDSVSDTEAKLPKAKKARSSRAS